MTDNYSIKEVIEQRFDEMTTHLVDIKTQVVKTNGRVSSLENHRFFLWGAITVIGILGTFATKYYIQETVRDVLADYNITYED